MVTPALLGLSRPDEGFHGLENLVHAAHVPIDKVSIVDLQKPMILLVLLVQDIPLLAF